MFFCLNLVFQHPKISSLISNVKVIQPHVGLHRNLQHNQSHRVPKLTPDLLRGRCTPQSPPRTRARARARARSRGSGRSPRRHGRNHGCGGVSQHGKSSCRSCSFWDDRSDVDGKVGAVAVRSDDFVSPQPSAGKQAKGLQGSETASC